MLDTSIPVLALQAGPDGLVATIGPRFARNPDDLLTQAEAWLYKDHQFPPGKQLFQSDRRFTAWAYTVSHSQLLLRTRTGDGRSRIDILFKPVEALKVRTDYDGQTIRCATGDGYERALAARIR